MSARVTSWLSKSAATKAGEALWELPAHHLHTAAATSLPLFFRPSLDPPLLFGNRVGSTYRWAPPHALTRTRRKKQLLLVIKDNRTTCSTASAADHGALQEGCRWRYSNHQPSKSMCNNVILLYSDLVAIQLHQHSPVCSNLCLFNRNAHRKNADRLQISIYSNQPSPRYRFLHRTKRVNLELQNSFLPASEEILAWWLSEIDGTLIPWQK